MIALPIYHLDPFILLYGHTCLRARVRAPACLRLLRAWALVFGGCAQAFPPPPVFRYEHQAQGVERRRKCMVEGPPPRSLSLSGSRAHAHARTRTRARTGTDTSTGARVPSRPCACAQGHSQTCALRTLSAQRDARSAETPMLAHQRAHTCGQDLGPTEGCPSWCSCWARCRSATRVPRTKFLR